LQKEQERTQQALRLQQKELGTAAARLKRLRANQRLLEERGYKALFAESGSLAALDEHDRREAEELLAALAEDEGYAFDPEVPEGPSASKRPRHEAVGPAAPQAAEPAGSAESAGEPVAGARSPRPLELVDSARLSPYAPDPVVLENFPLFSFGDDPVSVGDGSL